MSSHRSFHLTDAVAGLVLILLLLANVFAEQNAGRQNAKELQHMTQLKGIHSGAIFFAQGNNDWFPGLDSKGRIDIDKIVTGDDTNYGAGDTTGAAPAYRYAQLLDAGFFTPAFAISPLENRKWAKVGDDVTSANFSYAMLRLNDRKASGRIAEWRNTTSSQAAAMSDRNLAVKAGKNAESIISKGKQWTGAVAWNDNHLTMEKSNMLESTAFSGAPAVKRDDLFADDKDTDGNAGNDAAMVFYDASSYGTQK